MTNKPILVGVFRNSFMMFILYFNINEKGHAFLMYSKNKKNQTNKNNNNKAAFYF